MHRGYRAGHQGMQKCASCSSTSGRWPPGAASGRNRMREEKRPGAGVERSPGDVERPDEVVEGSRCRP